MKGVSIVRVRETRVVSGHHQQRLRREALRMLPATLIGLVCLISAVAAAELPESVTRVLKRHHIPIESLSVVVQALDASDPLISINPTTARNPASTIKLLSTFVALDVLGPTYTWPTEVYALGPIAGDVLEGDLLFKGHGDPHLVIEELWQLLGALRREGVRTIDGDLVIDDSHFAVAATDPGAFDKQPFRLYNVIPNALLVNFQSIEFEFVPQGRSQLEIRTNPALPNLNIINRIKVVPGPCRNKGLQIVMDTPDPAQPDDVVFTGRFPGSCRGYSLSRRVMEPHSYAFGLVKLLWAQWGGELHGGVRRGVAPEKSNPLLVWRSKPLAELIRGVNKWSNNVMTRMLLYTLATTKYDPPVTREQGVEVIEDYLNDNGIPTTGLVIDNGAGLSRNTRISAAQMTALLRHAYNSRFMPEFIASMSIAGLDGTMRKRFRSKPEAGNMHIKTGRLNNAVAIAGYVRARSGAMFSVVLALEHAGVHYGTGNVVQDALLSWVYRQH